MNTGVIVYIIGNYKIDSEIDHKKEIANLNIDADIIEFISPTEGHFDINDIWITMVGKGMNKIILMSANITKDKKLKLTGKKLQLRGNV